MRPSGILRAELVLEVVAEAPYDGSIWGGWFFRIGEWVSEGRVVGLTIVVLSVPSAP